MNALVVDSSVVIKWLIHEPYSIEARQILEEYQDGLWSLQAPDLIYAELGNIL